MDDERPGGFDRSVFCALLASGALWIVGFTVGLRTGLYLGGFAAVYVVVAGLAMASRSLPTARTFMAAWVGAVLLLTVLIAPFGWVSLAVGAIVGSALFLAWSLAGFVLLGAVTGRAPGDPSRRDPPA